MVPPAVDVVAEEVERWLSAQRLPVEHDPDAAAIRECAADVVAALWDAGYAVTPQGARDNGSVL